MDRLQAVSATPFQLHGAKAPEVVFRKQGEPERVGAPVVIARNVYIKAADLAAYGHTRGCGRLTTSENMVLTGVEHLTRPYAAPESWISCD